MRSSSQPITKVQKTSAADAERIGQNEESTKATTDASVRNITRRKTSATLSNRLEMSTDFQYSEAVQTAVCALQDYIFPFAKVNRIGVVVCISVPGRRQESDACGNCRAMYVGSNDGESDGSWFFRVHIWKRHQWRWDESHEDVPRLIGKHFPNEHEECTKLRRKLLRYSRNSSCQRDQI